MLRHPVTRLRWVSVAEATSFVLLLVATALKYAGPEEEVGVQVLGPVHGALFVLYVVLALQVWFVRRWSLLRAAVVIGAAVLPLAPYVVERTLLREDERAHSAAAPPAAQPVTA